MYNGFTNQPEAYGKYIFMGMDVTIKGMGRMNMNEMCSYEVKDDKIISERFTIDVACIFN